MKFVKKVLLAVIVLLSAFAEGKSKAYDYEVEYIRPDYYSYIDTGIKTMSNSSVTVDMYEERDATGGGLTTSMFGNADCYLKIFWYGGANVQLLVRGVSRKTVTDWMLKRRTETFTAPAYTSTTDQNLFLFAANTEGCRYHNRYYRITISNGDGTVADFIPVVKSGEGMMYDKVSGQLFRNAGTGSFAVGPRKADSAVEIAMGEMEVRQ